MDAEILQGGQQAYDLMKRLFPICRSLTGDGVRQTLAAIKELLPELQIHEVPSGTRAFDWTIPKEWSISEAYILSESGEKIIDFKNCNLHVVGYSRPVDATLSLDELQRHLHSLESQPDAIPYVTSYYKDYWGFCMAHSQRLSLKPGNYRAVIKSELKDGSMTYAELRLPGREDKELFFSSYVCHPSMANNELSGPALLASLALWLKSRKDRRLSYRFFFGPETIGAICYLSRNFEEMKRNVLAGLNVTCAGDGRAWSIVHSRYGDNLADRLALCILRNKHPEFKSYSFLERGSDERQYCSPGVDLPIATFCRSKFYTFPEYHSSLDDLSMVSPESLAESLEFLADFCELAGRNFLYRIKCLCEPNLGSKGLYPAISTKESRAAVHNIINFISYADGRNDLAEISRITSIPPWDFYGIIDSLKDHSMLDELECNQDGELLDAKGQGGSGRRG